MSKPRAYRGLGHQTRLVSKGIDAKAAAPLPPKKKKPRKSPMRVSKVDAEMLRYLAKRADQHGKPKSAIREQLEEVKETCKPPRRARKSGKK